MTADTLDDGLDKPVKPAIYLPYTVNMWMWTQILVRSRVDPRSVTHSVKQQIVSVNPDQQATMWDDGVLETWIKNQQVFARGRLVSVLFAAFSVLALLLAAIGLYSVVSYSVVQRTNEFGIRMALGGQRWHVLKIVFASAGVSVVFGIVAGLGLSFAPEPLHCSVGGECLDEPSHSVRRFPFAARRGGSGVPGAGQTSVGSRPYDGVTKRVISVAEDA